MLIDGTAELCEMCLATCPLPDLKRAWVPTLPAIMLASDPAPDDVRPMDLGQLIDRHLYCPSCRFRVNRRRLVGILLILISSSAAVFLLSRWIGN